MTGCGRMAAVLAGIVLLFPGLCFLIVGGLGLKSGAGIGNGFVFIAIAVGIIWFAVWLLVKAGREPEPWFRDQTESSKEQEPPKTE